AQEVGTFPSLANLIENKGVHNGSLHTTPVKYGKKRNKICHFKMFNSSVLFLKNKYIRLMGRIKVLIVDFTIF
ncbi:hypothetical protein, partial [Salmonella sp. gx-f5]|uniref:hypothetical protein n=1 Tax=Salmonella sp. gx-f5 TaxID=2582605 RepID=UPI001F3AE911